MYSGPRDIKIVVFFVFVVGLEGIEVVVFVLCVLGLVGQEDIDIIVF